MCLIVFAWRPDAAQPLLLAANRDEFHARPAAASRAATSTKKTATATATHQAPRRPRRGVPDGSISLTTSPRTPPHTVEVLKNSLPEGARFFEWRRGAPDNPYRGLLGLADGFIVTGDSISMLVEVAKLGAAAMKRETKEAPPLRVSSRVEFA
mgnify:CR=1 FL=1